MTIRHLKIFLAVADEGNMSGAARSLFLSQPTVSQAIRELEEHFHVLLFERFSRKLYMTQEGKRLLLDARQVVEQFDALEERMNKAYEQEHLRIGMTLTVGNCMLSKLLSELRLTCPGTDIYTFVGNTSIIEEKLLHAQLGVGIVEGTVKSPELISIPKVKDRLVLACASTHPLAGRGQIEPWELERQPFAMRETGSGTRALFEQYLKKFGLTVQGQVETDAIEIIREAVLCGGCMAVISERLLEREIKNGDVCLFYPEGHEWERSFSLVYHKNKYITPAMEILGGLLERERSPLEGICKNMGIITGGRI